MWTTPEFAHFTEIMRKLTHPSVMMAVHPPFLPPPSLVA